MKVELLDYTENGIALIAKMGRATRCNKLDNDMEIDKNKDEKFVKALMVRQHLGVLEHINFTFHVSEISRCLTHQLVRHRIASYLQMSNRHAKPETEKSYVTPHTLKTDKAKKCYEWIMETSLAYYNELINEGVPVEDARYVLPPAFYTHISITMNVRELRHFLELRCDKSAQWEIRELAMEILDICYDTYPVLFEDIYKRYK